MSTPTQPTEAVLGVAFAQARDIIEEAVGTLGVGRLIHLSNTHRDVFQALDAVLTLLRTHESRVLS